MIVRSFLAWTATAPAAARAEGAAALATAYLAGELDPADRRDAETALTALLDDPSPLVRIALAIVLAPATASPHHLLTALLGDRSDIAALVLEASPLLSDDELIDAAAVGDAVAQAAIARRPYLTAAVAGALAEVGALPACQVLLLNETASVAPLSLRRLVQRFGDDAELRVLLGARVDLDAGLRHDVAVATGRALERFVAACGWLPAERAERVTREATEQAAVVLAAGVVRAEGGEGLAGLVQHLAAAGRLTPALLLRAILTGNLVLFEAAVSALSGLPLARVAGLVRGASGLGFAALYAKAGLPPDLMATFETAARECARERGAPGPAARRAVIGKVMAACRSAGGGDLGTVFGLLRRLDAQAARDEARLFAVDVAREHVVPALPRPTEQDRSHPLRSAA